jgi:hypothetical protein
METRRERLDDLYDTQKTKERLGCGPTRPVGLHPVPYTICRTMTPNGGNTWQRVGKSWMICATPGRLRNTQDAALGIRIIRVYGYRFTAPVTAPYSPPLGLIRYGLSEIQLGECWGRIQGLWKTQGVRKKPNPLSWQQV